MRSRSAASAVRAGAPPGCPGSPGALRWERAPAQARHRGQGKCRCRRRFPVVLTGDSWERHVPRFESGEKPLAPPVPGWINEGQRPLPAARPEPEPVALRSGTMRAASFPPAPSPAATSTF